jgi:hypothetical protein
MHIDSRLSAAARADGSTGPTPAQHHHAHDAHERGASDRSVRSGEHGSATRHEHAPPWPSRSHAPRVVSWAEAANATLHCLTGCAIGEISGLVAGTAVGLSNGATIAFAVMLAFVFGFALTMRPLLRSGMTPGAALRVAFAADAASITIMEVVDNAIMLAIPGAMDAALTDILFWATMTGALVVAGLVAWPVNRWLMSRGRGHAVVHAFHHH